MSPSFDHVDPVGDLRATDEAGFDACQSPAVVLVETNRADVAVEYRKMNLVRADMAGPCANGFDHALAGTASVMRGMHMKAIEQDAARRIDRPFGADETDWYAVGSPICETMSEPGRRFALRAHEQRPLNGSAPRE